MHLVLQIGNKVRAIAPIDKDRAKDWDYLQAKKRLLLTIHQVSIAALREEPFFYLSVQSRVNNRVLCPGLESSSGGNQLFIDNVCQNCVAVEQEL